MIPNVDGRFRTVANRSERVVDGFSLGGFQSMWRGERPERASVQWIVLVIEMRSLRMPQAQWDSSHREISA